MKKFFSLLILMSTACWAAENQMEYMYGWANPRSSVDVGNGSSQEGSRGLEWSADILHKAASRFYLGVGGGRFHSDDTVTQTFIPNADSTISSKMDTILGLGRVDLNATPKVLTYLIGGVGWVRHTLTVTSTPITIVDAWKDTFGYAAGLGIDFALNDRLYVGVEGRYQGSLRESFQLTPDGVAATGRTSVSVPLSVFLVGIKAGIRY